MSKPNQRKKQAASKISKPSSKNQLQSTTRDLEKLGLHQPTAELPEQCNTQEMLGIIGVMTDPRVSAKAAEIYAKRSTIDCMCRVIEHEPGRTLEEKLELLDHVADRENGIRNEAHKQTLEDRNAAQRVVLTIVGCLVGLGLLNQMGIIKLPPFSIS